MTGNIINQIKRLNKIFIKQSKIFKLLNMHRRYIIVGGFVSVLIIIFLLFTQYNEVTKERIALKRLNEIEEKYKETFKNSKFDKTYSKFKPFFSVIIRDLKRENTIKRACLFLGKISYDIGDFETAILTYEQGLKFCNDDLIFMRLLFHELAYSYLSNNSLNKAIMYFRKIVETEHPLMREDAFFNMASTYELLGNTDKATKLYKQFLVEFPNSIYSKTLNTKLN